MTAKTVLLVEDDPSDVLLMQEAIKDGQGLVDLQVAVDGDEAMVFLRGRAKPSLILLDWRLPKMSGREVLCAIRADPALSLIPVLILTTSASEQDVCGAYAAGANCFLTKPTGIDSLRALTSLIERFWLVHARLPN